MKSQSVFVRIIALLDELIKYSLIVSMFLSYLDYHIFLTSYTVTQKSRIKLIFFQCVIKKILKHVN